MYIVQPLSVPSALTNLIDDQHRLEDKIDEALRSGDKAIYRLEAEWEEVTAKRRALI
jgi:hypothetical protein